MNVIPPYTGNAELDTFLYDLAVNGSGSVSTNTVVPDAGAGDVVGYQYRYLHVKYADNNTGSGISNTQTNKLYFGIFNSELTTESNNPSDYTWFTVANGFGTQRSLYYKPLGARSIKFAAETVAPDTTWKIDSGIAIDLDVIIPPQTIGNTELLNAAVTELKIANQAITAAKTNIAALDQATGNLNANTVSADQIINNAVTEIKIAAEAITSAKVGAGAITTTKISDTAITTDKIAANAIVADKIAANTITGNKIAAETIGAGQIAANAITAVKIEAGAVVAGKIASDAVTTNNLVAGSITGLKIAAGTITSDNIATNTITAASGIIADAAITSAKIGDAEIGTLKVAGNAITAVAGGDVTGLLNGGGAGAFTIAVQLPAFATSPVGAGKILINQQQSMDISVGAINDPQNRHYAALAFYARAVGSNNGTATIAFQKSTNGGGSWSDVRTISATGGGTSLYLQWGNIVDTVTPGDTVIYRWFISSPNPPNSGDIAAINSFTYSLTELKR